MEHTFGKGCGYFFSKHIYGWILFLPPIVFSPIVIYNNTTEYRCMYITLVMVVYWVTEVLPLGVTSLLPTFAFPIAGIMTADMTCRLYFKDTLGMFTTSIMVACAIEYSNLHIRIALKTLQVIGCSARKLHFGVTLVTFFMSVWIANTATTAMMLPIIFAILTELSEQKLIVMFDERDMDLPIKERRPSRLAAAFYLTTSYASSIGGCGSLIGTPTNLTFKGIYESRFPNADFKMEFGDFLYASLPLVIVMTAGLYLSLQVTHFGLCRPESKTAKQIDFGEAGEELGKRVIDGKYDALGPITCHEISVALLFTLLIILYIARKPGFVPGWAEIFEEKGIKNSAPTIIVLLLIFSLPANYKFLKTRSPESMEPTPPLHDWGFLIKNTPWGLIFLVGGGSVLAQGAKDSGMSKQLGTWLTKLDFLPPLIILFFAIAFSIFFTNFSANVAICNIIVPVLCEMTVQMEIHPLTFVYPVGIATSMAFLSPVGTGPNALVQAYSNTTTKQMAIAGALPSVAMTFIIFIMSQLWVPVVFPGMGGFPEWAKETEDTSK